MIREPQWQTQARLAELVCILLFVTSTGVIRNHITLLPSIKVITLFLSSLVLGVHVRVHGVSLARLYVAW